MLFISCFTYKGMNFLIINLQSCKTKVKSQINPTIQKLHVLIIVIFLASLKQVQGAKVGPILPIRVYQHPQIETGSQVLTSSNDQNTGSAMWYDTNYTITFQRISVAVATSYGIATSLSQFDWRLSGSMYIKIAAYNPTTTNFQLALMLSHQNLLTSARVSYLIVTKFLVTSQKLVIFSQISTFLDTTPTPICDGLLSNCAITRPKTLNIPHKNYRMFYNFRLTAFTRNSDLSLIPSFKSTTQIIDTTTSSLTYYVEYIKVDYVGSYVILIHEDLFKTDIRRPIHFSSVFYQHSSSSVSIFNYQLTFPHYVFGMNTYVALTAFGGNQINFDVAANNPVDFNLVGKTFGVGNSVSLWAIGFYGYIKDCQPYLTMTCNPCPSYCWSCDVYPTFHCESCYATFVMALDKQSCLCPPPFLIVEDLCGPFPPGCVSGQLLPDNTAVCALCDITKNLVLVGTSCQCKNGFQFDLNGVCQDICGDGLAFESECDDGNTQSGDGCSSSCLKENTGEFKCDFSVTPTVCKSERMLKYEIKSIMKQENENSVFLTLSLSSKLYFPFPIKRDQLFPLSFGIKLKIILSESPWQEHIVTDHELIEVTEKYDLLIEMPYSFSLQGLKGQILLNYEKTQYKNETQTLDFTFEGSNHALKYDGNGATYKTFGYAMLTQTILIVISLVIGLIAPKFIGLELILTLQLIFFSQLLIHDVKNWPPGFVFLKYLKYSTGFNDVFSVTQNVLTDTVSKKMSNLSLKKLVIENFNVSFVFMLLTFIGLVVCFIVKLHKENQVIQQAEEDSRLAEKNNQQTKNLIAKRKAEELTFYYRVNEVSFFLANQTSFWLLLPLMSALSAELLIPSSSFVFINGYSQNSLLVRTRAIVALISFTIILLVALNNFKNMWLSLPSHNRLLERPEELTYKRLLFVYLCLIGCLIFFCNTVKLGVVHCSAVAMLLHIVFMVSLVRIHPYRQSLRVHTVSLLFNNTVLLVFLFVVNLINYVDGLDSLIILVLGYFVTVCCLFQILLTFVRLYYELRYGRELQIKIQEQREYQRQQEELERLMKIKENENRLEQQANMRKNEKQKIRDKNIYLYENQIKQDQQNELLEWLQTRQWQPKQKDNEYFKKYTQKPLSWLRLHDPLKYQEKMNQIKNRMNAQVIKKTELNQCKEYKHQRDRLNHQYLIAKRTKTNNCN